MNRDTLLRKLQQVNPATFQTLVDGLEDGDQHQAVRLVLAEDEEGWKLRTLKEAYAPRPKRVYIVEGLIELPSLNIFYGSPGTLKSMLLADMSVCVADGREFLPKLLNFKGQTMMTKCLPVLWVDLDQGERRNDERFEALARARDLPEDAPIYYVSMPNPMLDASSQESIDELVGLMLSLQIRLLVIDNLGLVTGGTSENEPGMASIMGNLRAVAEKTGAAIILIHHQRKTTGIKGRKGDNLRGHSSIEASLDLAVLIEREGLSGTIKAIPTKVRAADMIPMFGAMFTYKHKPGTLEMQVAQFYAYEVEDTTSSSAIRKSILGLLDGNRLNKTHLTESVKDKLPEVGVNRIRAEIEIMTHNKQIIETPGRGTELLYSRSSKEETYGDLRQARKSPENSELF